MKLPVLALFSITMTTSACGTPNPSGGDASPGDASDIVTSSDGADAPAHPADVITDALTDAGLCPAPEHPEDGSVEFARIPRNFDATSLIRTGGRIPVSGAPDVVGAFRFICSAGHLGYDDPIVFPCEPGRSHLHQFFGNTLTNAYSNYESLRTTGDSTCENMLNRSAYWIPAMMNGRGQVVRPDYVTIYYKRYPETSMACTREATACVPVPRGLRYVFGFNLIDPTQAATGGGHWNCDGPTGQGGTYHDIVEAATHCPPGNHIGAIISAQPCWNGRDLDSPDHRSHMAGRMDTHLGYAACPATHPYLIPTFTLGAWYMVDDTLDRSGTWTEGVTQTWYLSSDMSQDGSMVRPGTTLHADWFGAWDDEVMDRWHAHCINELLNCSAGEFGDGTAMQRFPGFSWSANPRIVDPPPHP